MNLSICLLFIELNVHNVYATDDDEEDMNGTENDEFDKCSYFHFFEILLYISQELFKLLIKSTK